MEKKTLTIDYCEYGSLDELPAEERKLMECAMRATAGAYAPYSGFHVGAAVLLADGSVVTGNNQENIAYPSGMCAERVALFSASAQRPKEAIVALAVVGWNKGEYCEASPCGACRQTMAEYEMRSGNKMKVYCYVAGGRIRCIEGVEKLIPFGFEAKL